MQIEVLTFKNRSKASEVLDDIQDADFDWGTDIAGHAVAVTKSKRGKVRIHHAHEARKAGTIFGAATGMLAGTLVLHPIAGAAWGGAAGAAIGSIGDPVNEFGMDKKFLKELGSGLENNSSALFVTVPNARAKAAAEVLGDYAEAKIIETTIDDAIETRLENEMRKRT